MPTSDVGTALLVGRAGNNETLDEDTSEQIDELTARRDIHEARLRQLLRQEALFGWESPVHITGEIEDIQVKVGHITADIARLQIGASKRAQMLARAESTSELADISTQIGDTSAATLHGIHTLIALLLQDQDADAPQRQKRQRVTTIFYVVISLLVLVDVLVRILIH